MLSNHSVNFNFRFNEKVSSIIFLPKPLPYTGKNNKCFMLSNHSINFNFRSKENAFSIIRIPRIHNSWSIACSHNKKKA